MNPPPRPSTSLAVPSHWSPQQALAVLEALQAVREAVWLLYGQQAQQAWRDQLVPDHGPLDFDPELPF
jgi:hypothetical protein